MWLIVRLLFRGCNYHTVQSDISFTSFTLRLAWAFSFPGVRLFRAISPLAISLVRSNFFKRRLVSTTMISSILSLRCVGIKNAVSVETDVSGSSFKRVLLYLRRNPGTSYLFLPFIEALMLLVLPECER